MGYYIGEIIKLRNKFFEASDKADFAEAIKLGKDIIKLYKDNNDCESLEYANDLNNQEGLKWVHILPELLDNKKLKTELPKEILETLQKYHHK